MQTEEITKKETENESYERLEMIPDFSELLPTYSAKGFTGGHLEVFDNVLDSFLHLVEIWSGIKIEIKAGREYNTHYLTAAELDPEKSKKAGLCIILLRQIVDINVSIKNFSTNLDKITDQLDPQATIRWAFLHLKKLTKERATVKEVFKKHICGEGQLACAKNLTIKSCDVVINKISSIIGEEKLNQQIKYWEEFLKNQPSNPSWQGHKSKNILNFLESISHQVQENYNILLKQIGMDLSVLDDEITEVITNLKKSRLPSRVMPNDFHSLFLQHIECVIYIEGLNKKIEFCTDVVFKKMLLSAIPEYLGLRQFIFGDILLSIYPTPDRWRQLIYAINEISQITTTELQQHFSVSEEHLQMLKAMRENLLQKLQAGVSNYENMLIFLNDPQLAAFLTRESLYWTGKTNYQCLLAIQKRASNNDELQPEIHRGMDYSKNLIENILTQSSQNSLGTEEFYLSFILKNKNSQYLSLSTVVTNPIIVDFTKLEAEAKKAPAYFSEEATFQRKSWLLERKEIFLILDQLVAMLPSNSVPQQNTKELSPKGWQIYSTAAPNYCLSVLPFNSANVRDTIGNLCNNYGKPEIIAKPLKSGGHPCLALSFHIKEPKLQTTIFRVINQLKEIFKIEEVIGKIKDILSQKERDRCSYVKTLFSYIPVVGQYMLTDTIKIQLCVSLKKDITDISYEKISFDFWLDIVSKILEDPQAKYRQISDMLASINLLLQNSKGQQFNSLNEQQVESKMEMSNL